MPLVAGRCMHGKFLESSSPQQTSQQTVQGSGRLWPLTVCGGEGTYSQKCWARSVGPGQPEVWGPGCWKCTLIPARAAACEARGASSASLSPFHPPHLDSNFHTRLGGSPQ